MSGNVTILKPKQEEAIIALLTSRNVEEAARAVKITPRTLYRGLGEPEFDKAYRKARRHAFAQPTAQLQQASSAAVSVMMKTMVEMGAAPSTRLRAADLVYSHSVRAIEIEDIEARVLCLCDAEPADHLYQGGLADPFEDGTDHIPQIVLLDESRVCVSRVGLQVIPIASTPDSTIRSATSPACAAGPWCGTMMSEKTNRGNSEPARLNSSRTAQIDFAVSTPARARKSKMLPPPV